jgi:hypothetical protein
MTLEIKIRILELYEAGMLPGDIAKKVNRMTRDVDAIIQLYAKKPDLLLGFKGMRELAREAGLIL